MKNIQKIIKSTTQILKNVCRANFSIKTNIQDKIDISTKKDERLPTYSLSIIQRYSLNRAFKNSTFINHIKYDYSTKMNKYAPPTNDFVFKKLFDEKILLIDFINSALPDRKVKDIEHLSTDMLPDIRTKKESILDVLCTDEDGSKYIIEMQAVKEKGFEKRAAFYASKIYSSQLDISEKYADLKDVIFIAITNFVLFPNKEDCFSIHHILDKKTYEHDLKAFSFAFIELPKFKEQEELQGELHGIYKWCDFFKNAEYRKSIKTKDPIMQKAYEIVEMSNWTEQELFFYEAHKKIIMDNQAI